MLEPDIFTLRLHRYRERISRTYERALEAHRFAQQLEARAAAVGTGGISSDDPDAVVKLGEKLARLERRQELMLAANREIRRGGADLHARLVSLGLDANAAGKALVPDFAGRTGFPSYALQTTAPRSGASERASTSCGPRQRLPFANRSPATVGGSMKTATTTACASRSRRCRHPRYGPGSRASAFGGRLSGKPGSASSTIERGSTLISRWVRNIRGSSVETARMTTDGAADERSDSSAELNAGRRIGAGDEPENHLECAWCRTGVQRGALVCTGCNADVVYSATPRELSRGFKLGCVVAVVPALALLGTLIRWQATGSFVALVELGVMVGGGLIARTVQVRRFRGRVRFFRRTNL